MQSGPGDLREREVTQQAGGGRGLTYIKQNTRFEDLEAPFQADREISSFQASKAFLLMLGCPQTCSPCVHAELKAVFSGHPCSASTSLRPRTLCLSCIISECLPTTQ